MKHMSQMDKILIYLHLKASPPKESGKFCKILFFKKMFAKIGRREMAR